MGVNIRVCDIIDNYLGDMIRLFLVAEGCFLSAVGDVLPTARWVAGPSSGVSPS